MPAPSDGNGSGIQSFELYYRLAGESWNEQNKTAFQNDLATIPAEIITTQGVDYQIVAEDFAENRSYLQNGVLKYFSIPVQVSGGELQTPVSLRGGTGKAAYQLVSLPLAVGNQPASEVFTNLGNYGKDNDYRFWQYVNSSFGEDGWREGSDIVIQPGESYFLIKRESGSLSNNIAATTVKSTEAELGKVAGWQLKADDWTLIGNPFNFEIDLTNLRLKNRDSSFVFTKSIQYWAYTGVGEKNGWTNKNLQRLAPWGGLAIRNLGNVDTLISIALTRVLSTSKPSLAQASGTNYLNTTQVDSLSENEWIISIRAESEGFQDNENHLGVHKDANANIDAYDLYEPPIAPGGLSLSFVVEARKVTHKLAKDIRPPTEDGYEWTLQLKGTGGSRVRLHFDELATLPQDKEVYLLDRTSRILRDIRQQPEIETYIPSSTRTKILTLLIGDKQFVDEHSDGLKPLPTNFVLHQNYPNPFNPTTVIRYELPIAGKVTLKIYNLLGSEVMTLSDNEFTEPGFYENVVDLSGFASGIYFYRISVNGRQRYSAMKKMVLAK